jgi:acyl-CoA thioesterase
LPDSRFDSDTAVRSLGDGLYAAQISQAWRAGRGAHGGYLAAVLLRALCDRVADEGRPPRSLTIHYLAEAMPGALEIATTVERHGRALSTLSARATQAERVVALALAAFSGPWEGAPDLHELPLPHVAPPDPAESPLQLRVRIPYLDHVRILPRLGMGGREALPEDAPMEVGAWLELGEPRALDPLALALFCDTSISPPLLRLRRRANTPTIDLTIHFRVPCPSSAGEPEGAVFARFRTSMLHDGFFEEDGVLWSPDGTVLAHSRQLALVLLPDGGQNPARSPER